jgi:putative spermidine/putrescine transport system substrate-binding protein
MRYEYFPFITIILIMSIMISGCGASSENSKGQHNFVGEELVIGSFGGELGTQMKNLAGDIIESLTGADVRYVHGTSRLHLKALLDAKNEGKKPPFDVVLLDGVVIQLAEDKDLLEKATQEDIPQMEHLIDQALPQGNYGPAFQFFSVGIAYDYAAIAQAGVAEPTSWGDFWKPELKGHVAVPGIYHTAGIDFVMAATQVGGGNPVNLEDIKRGIDRIKALEPALIYQHMEPLKERIDKGEIWMFPIYNSRAYNWIGKGSRLRFCYPKERGFGHLTTISTVKGASNKKLADLFVNLVLTQGYQYAQAIETPFGPVNVNVVGPLGEFPKIGERCPLGGAGLERLTIPPWKSINVIRTEIEQYWFEKFPATDTE